MNISYDFKSFGNFIRSSSKYLGEVISFQLLELRLNIAMPVVGKLYNLIFDK